MNARLFVNRWKDYDPNLIEQCGVDFRLYRLEKVAEKVKEYDPKKRRRLLELKFIEFSVMDNTQRERVLEMLHRDKVRRSSSSQSVHTLHGTNTSFGSSSQRDSGFGRSASELD